jgi:Flp pilus assembly protein TadG
MSPLLLRRDESGAVLVELSILLPIVITVLCGAIDVLYAFYQWNAAAKAVQVGARIAAVSDPVATGLNSLSNQVLLSGLVAPKQPMPSFQVTCDGSSATCTCVGTCADIAPNPFSRAAMNAIVFGRGSASCTDATSYYTSGMCDILPSISPANVRIVYTQTGLGYAGRPGGPIPTITVALQNMHFQFFFLSYLLGPDIPMPAMTTTITAEDLCSGGGSGSCGS